MKPNVLVSLYNVKIKSIKDPDYNIVSEIIRDLVKPVSYISYDEKLDIIEKTISDSKGSAHPTPDLYRYFIINFISTYTNIEMDLEGFDLLTQTQIIDIIISIIKSEYTICMNLLHMCLDDINRG